MEIKPKRIDFVGEPAYLIDAIDSFKEVIEKEALSLLKGSLENATAEITWGNLVVVVEGQMLVWSVDDLVTQLLQWLDEEPEEIAGVTEKLLPPLRRAVAGLERRIYANQS